VADRRGCLGRSFRCGGTRCFRSGVVAGVGAGIVRGVSVVVDLRGCIGTYSGGLRVGIAGVAGVVDPMSGRAESSCRANLARRLQEHKRDRMNADVFGPYASVAEHLALEIGRANSRAENASRPEGSSFVMADAVAWVAGLWTQSHLMQDEVIVLIG